jgi:hypothetical protein
MPVPVPNKDPYMNYLYCASGPDEKMVGRIEDAPSKKDKLPDLEARPTCQRYAYQQNLNHCNEFQHQMTRMHHGTQNAASSMCSRAKTTLV